MAGLSSTGFLLQPPPPSLRPAAPPPLLQAPLRLEPDNFTRPMWGGDWIPRLKGLPPPGYPVGESWELSAHRDRPSRLRLPDGGLLSLLELIDSHPEALLGPRVTERYGAALPLLLKLIDSRDDLSVQVHPPEAYARRVEHDAGKTESWLILEAGTAPGEGFIYLGFDPRTAAAFPTRQGLEQAFLTAVRQANTLGPTRCLETRARTAALVLPFLNRIPVRPGEVYHLPPGTVHAIGRGVRLLELQTSSDLTYRLWDWNRPDAGKLEEGRLELRPLHLERARAVLDATPREGSSYRQMLLPLAVEGQGDIREALIMLEPDGSYAASRLTLPHPGAELVIRTGGAFQALTALQGRAALFVAAGSRVHQRWGELERGHTVLIPAAVPQCRIVALAPDTGIIRSYVPSPPRS